MKDLQDFVAECRRLRASNSPNMVLCLDFIRYKVCNPRETIALCYLMSLPVDDDGWAAVSVSQWQHEFNLTAQMQSRLLRALKSRGLVEVAMRGMPAKRVVRVDLMSIWNTACASPTIGPLANVRSRRAKANRWTS